MPKSEKELTHKTLAREIETLVKRYSEVEDETVLEACDILTSIREPLSLSPSFFAPVVEYMEGLPTFLDERLTAK